MRTQEEIDKYLDKLIRNAEKRATKIFANKLKDILAEISELYEKYEQEGELTTAQLARHGVLQNMYNSIARHIAEAFDEAYLLVSETRKTVAIEQYARSAYVYSMATQLNMGFGAINPETIYQALANPIDKLTLPQIMEKNRREIVGRIQESVAQGLAGGESYGKIAKRIRESVGFGAYKARLISRTESGRSQSLARLKAKEVADQYVSTEKRWLSSHDLRVRFSHRVLDLNEADEQGYFHYKGYKAKAPRLFGQPNLDCNCRCSFITTIDGELPKVRRSRDYTNADYQQKLAGRIDHYMEQGMTERQAENKANREVMPPSQVREFESYDKWYESQFGG